MAKVSYNPKDLDAPHRTTALGFEFTGGGDAVEVPEGVKLDKFRGLSTYHPELGFTVTEDDPVPDAPTGLQAVHRGRGVYAIADSGVVLDSLPTMTKEEAAAFNALSNEDKAAFVDKASEPAPAAPVVPAATAPAA